jgi:hypothetical protein
MVYKILLNNSLKDFVEKLNIDQEQKEALVAKIPQLDKKQRIKLLANLGEVYMLNKQEEEVVEQLKGKWQE